MADKAKLSVNIETERFNCWVCGWGGRNLRPLMVRGSPELREYLTRENAKAEKDRPDAKPRCYTLPPGFTPLHRSAPATSAPYHTYLSRRGVSEHTVGLYRMGYVDTGWLAGRIVVPSFDATGAVNFWSARTIHADARPSYVLPDCSKDIISNEHAVDWSKPIYLVEGIFDEIAVGPQAIALYGKFLQPKLLRRLVEWEPPMVYVCLDSDARAQALRLVERLVGYDVPCSLLDLDGKDPGEIGSAGVGRAVGLSTQITGSVGLVRARI